MDENIIIFSKCANYAKAFCNPELIKLISWSSADNGKEEDFLLNTKQLDKICNECEYFKTKL